MARGYPDYFGQSIFPNYGSVGEKQQDEANILASDTTILVTVSGKGRTYGGSVYLYNIPDFSDAVIKMYIDGDLLMSETLQNMIDRQIYTRCNYPMVLSELREPDSKCVVQIAGDITFGQSLAIHILNVNAVGFNNLTRIYYTRMP